MEGGPIEGLFKVPPGLRTPQAPNSMYEVHARVLAARTKARTSVPQAPWGLGLDAERTDRERKWSLGQTDRQTRAASASEPLPRLPFQETGSFPLPLARAQPQLRTHWSWHAVSAMRAGATRCPHGPCARGVHAAAHPMPAGAFRRSTEAESRWSMVECWALGVRAGDVWMVCERVHAGSVWACGYVMGHGGSRCAWPRCSLLRRVRPRAGRAGGL
ncbi:hypothetical protein OH76DRAFT_367303 [Lentinus brumalis]|uniref:Uncharacterized protein n=1 Tax=Lentinus brumalis TaxID=2498619 RepID=A0A371DEB8_9APHY|nr:hypothetical protein OH76DRAFT_367303 [Polyporus brumalis]